MEWFFDGIGSQIVGILLTLIIGGTAGFVIRNKIVQSQKAKNNSIQSQIGNINISNNSGEANEIGDNSQKQVAGKDSTQIQAQTIIVNNGITDERAREISKETMQQVLAQNTFESGIVAQQRIEEFQDIVLPRIASIEKDYVSFSDPAFQILYKKAQISAACSERDLDYEMLSELIAHRINNKGNIKKKASIEKAVEIIDKIDEDALCGLTMIYAMERFSPISGYISEGFSVINNLYEKLQYMDLPIGNIDWIDNLDILGAVRVQNASHFIKFNEYCLDKWNGYACCGINKESPVYEWAINKLKEVGLPDIFLIDNELLDGYVRIPVENLDSLEDIVYPILSSEGNSNQLEYSYLSDEQKATIKEILKRYDFTPFLGGRMRDNFINKLTSFESINKALLWWDQLDPFFQITSIGRAIAHANAKRIDQSLPDLD